MYVHMWVRTYIRMYVRRSWIQWLQGAVCTYVRMYKVGLYVLDAMAQCLQGAVGTYVRFLLPSYTYIIWCCVFRT